MTERVLPPPPVAPGAGHRLPVGALEAVPDARRAERLTVVRAADDLERLRPGWLALGGESLSADPDYFHWSLYNEPHVVRPHVLALDGVRGRTIVAARITDVRLPCLYGRSTVLAPKIRALSIQRGCVVGPVDEAIATRIVDELEAALERGEADAILFRQLEHGSTLHRTLSARASFAARRQHAARTNLRWQIDLPAARGRYLASLSPSTRKAMRRTATRLEHQFGARLSTRVYRTPAELRTCLGDVETIAARTYQRRLGVGYLGNERQRSRLTTLARHGWLRAAVLYIDDRPAAFELGEVYGGRFNSIAGGYDPEYGALRVGAHLLVETICALADDPAVTLFDFGFGDAPYKRKFAQRAAVEGDFVLYARRPRPMAVSFVRTALLELSRFLSTSLDRLALLERIRRSRRHLARVPA